MGTGLSIKKALQAVGASYTIKRDSGDISGEYLDAEANAQVTKPFIREFFLEASLAYDSEVVGGDVIVLDTTDIPYMVMNKTETILSNLQIESNAVLYKCNISGQLLRPVETRNSNYDKVTTWSTVKDPAYCLLTDADMGTDLKQREDIGQITVVNMILFIPDSVGVQVFDRLVAASGEYYKIETILPRRFDGVVMCKLAEDTRSA